MTLTIPPTDRLYRADAYATRFVARVLSATCGAAPMVVLDSTLFHPTAGGQQHDTGLLAGRRVLNVINDKDEGRITHVLEPGPALGVGETVTGVVDWPRRFDFMQQHTGEHILGQAFLRQKFNVVAVALGEERCTLDLDGEVSGVALAKAEVAANEAIWAARPVTVQTISADEVGAAGLRRQPQVSGAVRVVEVEGWDRSACGGTHVKNSGEIGLVKVLGAARVKGGLTRVEFLCGRRALTDYTRKHGALTSIGLLFSAGPELAHARVEGLLRENAATEAALEAAVELTARAALEAARRDGLSVARLPDERTLRAAVKAAATQLGLVAVLGAAGERAYLAVVCGPQVELDARVILQAGLKALDGRGGGKANLAQGSGGNPGLLDAGMEAASRAAAAGLGRYD